ncbi:hypothetical protein QIS99_16250 [Streptomyces sp. B-S-A8]|uniref:Uncharacterized protein n=1 Tax=Streptomyces solicavernae TaxID=3043614 RepID=A0ABT6RTI5_9ACTN|nr:hypothetical protein [Streptomyces sp. B-S-A8]MDI3387739.1 hypothetical protein [Streptomyces sp. B-S-A8]
MPSPCDPGDAPAGDVGTALMLIDSRLKAIHAGSAGTGTEQEVLAAQFAASLGPTGADDLLDGACTLIYMYMQWLCRVYEEHDEDVIGGVVPNIVASLRMMPKSVRPEAVPTMAGLLIAAGTGLSPSLWRKQYGYWTKEEMNPLEATAFLLAEHINRVTDDPDFATRLISEALSAVEGD